MTFLSLALKYLIPRRQRLSVAIISLLSVGVISLVVWLIVVFLSVTEGIEKGWLGKLTTLHAPLRLTPTEQYYQSYYYQVDALSHHSGYHHKTIAEKRQSGAPLYDTDEDGPLPSRFPKPDLQVNDPVQGLFTVLEKFKESDGIIYQDFEISSALLKLQRFDPKTRQVSYLTQASYLTTPPNHNPQFTQLLVPPNLQDLTHQLALSSYSTHLSRQDQPALAAKTEVSQSAQRIQEILSAVHSLQLTTAQGDLPVRLLPENVRFEVVFDKDQRLTLPLHKKGATAYLLRTEQELILEEKGKEPYALPLSTPLFVEGSLLFDATPVNDKLSISATLQGISLQGSADIQEFTIEHVSFDSQGPSWLRVNAQREVELPTNSDQEISILLAKSFLDSGARVGDRGYLSYSMATSSALQEMRIPIMVAGFYDPGVLSIGAKAILVPEAVTRTINASSSSFLIDKTQANGILVWCDHLDQTPSLANAITQALDQAGLSRYWKVTPFTEYPFAKDLLEQFQSDKLLFMLVAILILIVGCCNILSMGVLLVNDKKKEIGILQAMGATRAQIIRLFAYCGALIGMISTCVGVALALITLHYVNALTSALSFLQGREMFNPSFFGDSLPNALSHHALLFIIIATPLISLLAALLPAIKACRLQPSTLLRSE